MKKSLIALAVAGALTAPMIAQADATLYGSLRVAVVDADGSELDIKDNSSRIGVKASSELFSGAKAIAHFETNVSTESGVFGQTKGEGRLAYVGATGDFGTVTVGRQWTPQYLWTSAKVDILDFGSNPTHNYSLAGRQGNTLAYISPDLSGFQVAAVLVARDGSGESPDEANTGDDDDAYNLAAHYSVGGFSVGVSTLDYQGSVDDDYTAVAASYEMDNLYVAAEYSSNDITDKDTWEVAGSYAMGNTKLLANYVDFEGDGSQVALEVQQKLGKQARVFANYIIADSDAEDNGDAVDTLSVGYRVDF
ncbi:porin [Marinobacterium arenosum]|uniref:porin n=1 Tax=Marinobacterium arenosum TaxID=2862496 RepID=UPI002103C410|nr:porin [Marinobacterium arenosum]